MPAHHHVEDEFAETLYEPYIEPTPEAFGICRVCCGDGRDSIDPHASCGNCGGDGRSIRVVTHEQYHKMQTTKRVIE